MLRWILSLAALALAAWYLSNRRRARRQDSLYTTVPTNMKAAADAARERAGAAAETVRATVEQAQQAAETARQQVGDAVATLQDQAGTVAQSVTHQVQATLETVSKQKAPATGQDAEAPTDQGAEAPTDQGAEAPAVHETVQAELADIGAQAETLKAQAEAPAADAEKSAGEAFGVGTTSDTDLKTTTAPVAADQSTATPSASEGVAPVGERPRPSAGEDTTTASGAPVNPLSATSDGATSTGQPEPLPQELTAGEPGTGGPAGSAQAPSTPDSTETPTTGMEQPPAIDRAAEVAVRTSGAFVGNKSTRVFHAADSGHLPAKNKRVYFESAEEAIAAGFRPAEGEGLEGNADVSRQ